MSHRCLTELRSAPPELFYIAALRYGNFLWKTGHSGRAILAVTRALYTELPKNASVLNEWKLPYFALYWIVKNNRTEDFPGNPRISFAHQATRIRGERADLRRARAWATWFLICKARPTLSADKQAEVKAPNISKLSKILENIGHPGESKQWLDLFK